MKRFWIFAPAAAILVLCALPAYTQPVISAKSGIISWVQGQVYMGDEAVEASATKFSDIKENVVVRTEDGRAEILLTPGVVMHVGEHSSFRMLTKRLIDTRLELLTGSAVVSAVEIAKDSNVTIVCKSGTVVLSKAGHYRLDAIPGRLKVFAGLADVQIGDRHIEVTAGKMVSLNGDMAAAEKFDKLDTDSLDNWARSRDQIMAMANVSTARSMSYAGYGYGSAGVWGLNPYFGLYTYIPASGRLCDPYYGYCYWSPYTVGRVYYRPPTPVYSSGGAGGFAHSYPGMGSTSGGYSGTMAASSSSVGASPAAAASASSSAASSAGSSSAGHGSAGGGGGGGRGH